MSSPPPPLFSGNLLVVGRGGGIAVDGRVEIIGDCPSPGYDNFLETLYSSGKY
jgi:hypothetical protein